MSPKPLTLVTAATGKTGRRIIARLEAHGWPVRAGSRQAPTPFDWHAPDTWPAALAGVQQVYAAYQPDLAAPGALDVLAGFLDAAQRAGVERVVLLSGRGEPLAQAGEQLVQRSGMAWTVIRASWFAQNFDEGMFLEPLRAGVFAMPNLDTPEPFIDVEDIADVAAAALTTDAHVGQLYEVTGPAALTLREAVAHIAEATGRPVACVPVDAAGFEQGLVDAGQPAPLAAFFSELVATVLDGRNVAPADGVQRALGRPPRRFGAYVEAAARAGAWRVSP